MARTKKKPFICHLHDDIMHLCKEIESELNYPEHRRIINKIHKILDTIEQARSAGISMEKRLNDYKSAIENLGYSRNKK